MRPQPPWLDVEFLTDSFYADPYPLYRRLLAQSPVAFSSKAGAWLVCSFADVSSGLSDPRLSSGARIPTLAGVLSKQAQHRNSAALACMARMMSFRDDPDHARLRRAVSRAFTPRRMAELEEQVREVVDDLLAAFPASGSFDLVQSLAFPLPAIVICRLLGIPVQMLQEVRYWADAVVTLLSSASMTEESADRAQAAVKEADDYIRAAIQDRLSHPQPDLLSTLGLAQDEGTMTADEVTAMVILLLFAGFETTEGLIGNSLRILLDDPQWWTRLAEEPELIPAFVEEVLRFDPSIHRQSRIAMDSVVIGDTSIEAGSTILFMIGASGHDPLRFNEPSKFDPLRSDAGNIGFGHGPHFCLGAPLARMETRVAIEALTARSTAWVPAGPITYGSLLAVRKPASIPVMHR